ncbi:hypothetical protein [Ramlibacter alkalitolerans]|jgi:hypothetical protein|uniref:HTH araC/xylS-type domain-containing protein n=1 Tax=Ramlibacter alkalitolerans TaxID=2039631 RepID=A0ABS1JHM2_9BURK|nr:hypothetical protein [Ramlibacter alkalitolerans]MBL0423701.1 hypothetical protein [Ramlibacter alkalitolerans]
MTIEVPALRLGLAGFSDAQQKLAAEAAKAAATPRATWELASFADADAWWLDGRRTLFMPNKHLRVQPAVPSGRSVQIALSDVDRPVAFSLPLAPDFKPAVSFALEDHGASVQVLHQFAGFMQTMLAQFCLASSIADNQPTLGAGSWEVLRGGDLVAVVDIKLGAVVDPSVAPGDFDDVTWCVRDHGAVMIPVNWPRASVSQLMWQYAQRSQRDLLPPHYRSKPLFFRRPPRLAQRQLRDAHLLLMRELVAQPGMTFDALQQATGLADVPLARYLSALYVVGSITSNPRRASAAANLAAAVRDPAPSKQSLFESVLDTTPRHSELVPRPQLDLTAPLPLTRH